MTASDIHTTPADSAPAERKLRILTVTNLWPENGDFRGIFVAEQVEAIRQLGHHVDVEVVAQSRGRRDYFLAAPRVRRRVRAGRYDVVHIHFGMTALAARFIGNVPRVLTLHGGDIHIPWQRWLTRLGWSGTERIYASQGLANDAGEPTATVIACGVDADVFRPTSREAARARLGIDHDQPIVLFGARPHNQVKGYDVFTAVMTELRARGHGVRELVLAEPNQPRQVVAAKFAAADVLLLTSRKGTESGPVVVKEAALMGLPVVSVNVGDVAEVLEGVTPSAVVEFPEPWGTADARQELVRRLADHVAEILSLGARSNGREQASRLDGRESALRVAEVYQRVARTASAPAPAENPLDEDRPGRGLRILAVTNMWPEGDSFRGIFVKEQVEALRRLGAQVDVEVVAQSRGRRDYLLSAPRIRRRARSGGYDIVHIHHGMVALACRFIGPVPRVLELYGHDVNWRWQRWITTLGWGGVAAKVYMSRAMAATAGDPEGRVIPNGVDFALFAPVDRAAARASFGIADQEKVALFGAAPGNWVKGYDVFTDVLTALRKRGLKIRELILPAAGQSREAVTPKFAAADVLLFTSRRGFEGSPTVVKEACAIGLPVVATNVGDVAETLAGVTPSAVVEFPEPWGSPEARESLVDQLAARVAETLETGTRSNGRERNAWLAWENIAAKVIEMYREVLGQERSRTTA